MKICIFKLKSAHRVLSIINGKKTTNYSSVKKKKKLFLPFKKWKKTNQSILSGNFKTWMLVENTQNWLREQEKDGKKTIIKGTGMNILIIALEDGRQQSNVFKIWMKFSLG